MYHPQIETFIAVADSGSFAKAGEMLFLSATAVMKQINALEKRIGVSLFVRTNHGLQLTESGKSFLQDAKYLTDYSARAIEKAREIENKEKNQTIRIGTSIMTPAKFLLDIWDEMHLYDKDLKIELIPFENNPVNSVEILRNLGKHIDIVAGLYDDDFLRERGCLAAKLYDKRILLAVPINHPLGKKETIGLSDLKAHRVMVIRKGWNTYIDALREELIANGVSVVDFTMFSINAYNQAARENLPIITVEGWEDVHPLLKLVPTDWPHKIPFGIFYSPSPSGQVKKFIDVVQKVARK
ncbi:MAG: LysR family transcriptional regulator [Christensenellaceae bacterium]